MRVDDFIWVFRFFFYVFNRLILHLFLMFFVHFPKCGHNTRSKKNIFFRDDKKRITRLIYIIETQRRRLLGGHSSQTKKYDSEIFLKFMHFLIDFGRCADFTPKSAHPLLWILENIYQELMEYNDVGRCRDVPESLHWTRNQYSMCIRAQIHDVTRVSTCINLMNIVIKWHAAIRPECCSNTHISIYSCVTMGNRMSCVYVDTFYDVYNAYIGVIVSYMRLLTLATLCRHEIRTCRYVQTRYIHPHSKFYQFPSLFIHTRKYMYFVKKTRLFVRKLRLWVENR